MNPSSTKQESANPVGMYAKLILQLSFAIKANCVESTKYGRLLIGDYYFKTIANSLCLFSILQLEMKFY